MLEPVADRTSKAYRVFIFSSDLQLDHGDQTERDFRLEDRK